MAIKVAILRTGEQIISDMKEIISDDNIVAYLLKDPHTLQINSPILISLLFFCINNNSFSHLKLS